VTAYLQDHTINSQLSGIMKSDIVYSVM